MEKTKEQVKRHLKEQYEHACNSYLNELLRMWELDDYYGDWVGDEVGGIYDCDAAFSINMDEIIYCVENDVTEIQFMEFWDYLSDAAEFGFKMPKLKSWIEGCPRTSEEMFKRLRELKANLNDAVDAEKKRVKKEEMDGVLEIKIDNCGLSARTENICRINNIETLGDLVKLHKRDWLRFRNAGKVSLAEVDKLLTSRGLSWAEF